MCKIFISGTSGSGKTTLAQYISHRYRIPFISGSSKEIWPKFDIKSHSDIINRSAKDVEFARKFQRELVAYREELVIGLDSFVTDRSPLDNLVYYLLQVSPNETTDDTDQFVTLCGDSIHRHNFKQIYLDVVGSGYKLENDGMRVNNEFYQQTVDSVFKYIMQNNLLFHKDMVHTINEWDWESRVEAVENIINPENNTRWQKVKKALEV